VREEQDPEHHDADEYERVDAEQRGKRDAAAKQP
jgi:hypothetical protein